MSRVFIDFGRNRVYALPEDGGEVMVFNDFLEMFEKLRPTIVVADSYPRKLLTYSSRFMLLRWSLRLGL
jgi:SpoU rRNA methylase family enzyme